MARSRRNHVTRPDTVAVAVVFDDSDRARADVEEAWNRACSLHQPLLIEVTVPRRLLWWVALSRGADGGVGSSETEIEMLICERAAGLAHALDADRPLHWRVVGRASSARTSSEVDRGFRPVRPRSLRG